MAPTNVSFPIGPSGQIIPYNYTVDYSPVKGIDVLDKFIKSCKNGNINTGFYYTVATNNWFNVEGGKVSASLTIVSAIVLIETSHL